jgi:hypothetical protein
MLGRCMVCCSSQRASIDARLAAGEPLAVLVNEYGLHWRDLAHHRTAHVLHREHRQRRLRTGSS